MVRSINQDYLQEGAEAIVLLEVRWGNGISVSMYADKTCGSYTAAIMNFSGIRSQAAVDGVASTSSCSFTLADPDGIHKAMMGTCNFEGSWAVVKYYYTNVAGVPSTIMFGRVSNVSWNDSDRSMTFEIVSAQESNEIGFSVDRGSYPNLSANCEAGFGKTWPMVFGRVAHSPTVLVQECPKSKALYPISLSFCANDMQTDGILELNADDDKLDWLEEGNLETLIDAPIKDGEVNVKQFAKLYVEEPERFPALGQKFQMEIEGVIFDVQTAKDADNKLYFQILKANVAKYKNIKFQGRLKDQDENNPKVAWLTEAESNYDLTGHWVYRKVVKWCAICGENEEEIIENQVVRQEGLKVWFKYPWKKGEIAGKEIKIPPKGENNYVLLDNTSNIDEAKALAKYGLLCDLNEFVSHMTDHIKQRRADARLKKGKDAATTNWGPILAQLDMIKFLKESFWHKDAGVTVRQWLPPVGDVYVANMFPSNQIIAVYGRRKMGKRLEYKFCPIPKSYYTSDTSRSLAISGGPASVTTIEFSRPLSSYHEQHWDDEVWVSLESSASSNSAQIIKNTIEANTTLICNAGSFATAISHVANYPCNFTLTQNLDAIAFIKQVAWQSCCALLFDGPEVQLIHLPTEMSALPGFTLNNDSCQFQTMQLGMTPIDDIVTRLEGTWRRTYSPEDFERKIVTGVNVSQYGLRKKTENIYIYNDYQLVARTLNFWAVRLGYSWKTLSVKSFSSALKFEPYDFMAVGFSFGASKGIVTSIGHDPHSNSTDITLQLPVVAGTNTTFNGFWQPGIVYGLNDPTAMLSETNASVVKIQGEKTLDELVRELHKMEDNSAILGKIKKICPDKGNLYIVDYYRNGPMKEATDKDKNVWDLAPFQTLKVGDWVQIKGGQDGFLYMTRVEMGHQLGMVIEKTMYDAKYTVRLLHTSEEPTATDGVELDEYDDDRPANPDWALDYSQEEEDEDDRIEEVTAINICELNTDQTFSVEPGMIVSVKYMANLTTDDEVDGWYWFEVPNIQDDTAAEVIDMWLDTGATDPSVPTKSMPLSDIDFRGRLVNCQCEYAIGAPSSDAAQVHLWKTAYDASGYPVTLDSGCVVAPQAGDDNILALITVGTTQFALKIDDDTGLLRAQLSNVGAPGDYQRLQVRFTIRASKVRQTANVTFVGT